VGPKELDLKIIPKKHLPTPAPEGAEVGKRYSYQQLTSALADDAVALLPAA
jgi:hypothetical protein